jgi:hypothetical protein
MADAPRGARGDAYGSVFTQERSGQMTVALVLDFPGGTMSQYHEVVERMHLDGTTAPGGRLHVAGLYDGGLRVIDVWEDMESFARFRDAKILPITQELGLPTPTVRVLEVDQERQGNGEDPAFVQYVIMPGIDRAAFDAADRKILPTGEPPAALTFHVNGPIDGGWCVIDGWTSKQARDEFRDRHIRPVFENVQLPSPPVFEDLIVESVLQEGVPAHAHAS